MNCYSENLATVSSTIYGTAGGRRSGLKAAKRRTSFLPSMMSPRRKSKKVFSKIKSLMSAALAKLKYALGGGKKRASQDHHAFSGEADITEIDEGGRDADDEVAASPWSEVTYEYDCRLYRGGSAQGQHSNAALNAGIARRQAEAAREHEERLRKPQLTPVIQVPLWIVEGILDGKYPNSGLEYLLELNADGVIEYKIGLANGGFFEFKMRGRREKDRSNNPQSSDRVTAQEFHRNDEAIGHRVVEHDIGSSSAGIHSETSTMQGNNTLWHDPNCSQRVCHSHIALDTMDESESWAAGMRALGWS